MSGYDRFLTLADELRTLLESMRRKLERRLPALPNGEEKKRVIRELDGELDDGQRLLREMQTEADSDLQVPLSYRQQLNSQIKDFRSQVDQIRVQTSRIKSEDLTRREGYSTNPFGSDVDKLALVFSRSKNACVAAVLVQAGGCATSRVVLTEPQQAAYRSQLLQGRSVLERTSDSLNRSLQVAAETEQIGTEVVGELHGQRETLETARNRLEETNIELGRSRKIIQSMGRRIVTNKIFLMIIIALEAAVLGGVTYWKFFSGK